MTEKERILKELEEFKSVHNLNNKKLARLFNLPDDSSIRRWKMDKYTLPTWLPRFFELCAIVSKVRLKKFIKTHTN